MRALHVGASLSPEWGGPVSVLRDLTTAFASKNGIECTIFAAKGRRVGTGTVNVQGVQTRLFQTNTLAQFWTGYAPSMADALTNAVKDHDIVHIHELWHYPHYAAYRAARKAGKPYVVTIHGELDSWALNHKSLKKRIYMRGLQRKILQQASALHAITPEEARQIRQMGLTSPVSVIPNGIFAESFESLPPKADFINKFPVLDGKRVILFLGRIHPKKGLDILAKAFAQIAESCDDVSLVVAGPDEGGYMAQVRAILGSAGVVDKAVFTGPLAGRDKLAALSAADIFVLSSYSEGFSIAVLEAMASGLPVVISEQCYFPEVANAGAGLIIPAETSEVRHALISLLDNAEQRRLMGKAGQQLVHEKYTWHRVAARIKQLYEDIGKIPHLGRTFRGDSRLAV